MHLVLLLVGLIALVLAWRQTHEDVHRLAWSLAGIVTLSWSYLWSPAIIQLGLPLLVLVAYLIMRIHPPRRLN